MGLGSYQFFALFSSTPQSPQGASEHGHPKIPPMLIIIIVVIQGNSGIMIAIKVLSIN